MYNLTFAGEHHHTSIQRIWRESIHLFSERAPYRRVFFMSIWLLYVWLNIYTCKWEPWHTCIHPADEFVFQSASQTRSLQQEDKERRWPAAGLFCRNLFRGDGDCVSLVVCFHRSGKGAMRQGNRGLITWFFCVVYCRPADRPQRGGRGQPGGDSRICQSIQDSPAIPGPDTDPGGPGAERRRGAGVQPVCHLQVRADTKAKKGSLFRINTAWFCQMKAAASLSRLPLIYFWSPLLGDITKTLKYVIVYHRADK